jgi:hypothetical protein
MLSGIGSNEYKIALPFFIAIGTVVIPILAPMSRMIPSFGRILMK